MKKIFFLFAVMVPIFVIGYNIFFRTVIDNVSNITLQNIEALAGIEDDDDDCTGFKARTRNVLEDQIETESCDGVTDKTIICKRKRVYCDMDEDRGTYCCKDNNDETLSDPIVKNEKTCQHRPSSF